MHNRRHKAGLITGLVSLLLSFSLEAGMNRPVIEDGKPTGVYVVAAILDVDKSDSTEQNFALNSYSAYRWTDPRLAHDGPGNILRDISDIWTPRLTILNTQKRWVMSRNEVEVSPDAVVSYRLHMFGSFSQPLDLHNFPHDRHTFQIPIVAAG
ncbi:MAG: hypothetical protein JSW45_04635 [Thiotrichales bacterium]|nr:MAG: hypothetical protein JSW45_04635 [Thiotrichales bacterium]